MTKDPNTQVTAALTEVLRMLSAMMEKAEDVSVDGYAQPTAQEALTWAISGVQTMINRHAGS